MWAVILAILFGSMAGGGSKPDPSRGESLAADLSNLQGGPDRIRELGQRAGLPDDWITFLVAKAWVESRWKPTASRGVPPGFPDGFDWNDAPWDQRAAEKSYTRQIERGHLKGSPWPRERYTAGSMGLWQLMPANGIITAFKGTKYELLDPWSHYMPGRGLAMAVAYNLGLMNWASYRERPTWATLYAGWSAPANMGRPESDKVAQALERFRKGLNAAGVSNASAFMAKRPSTAIPDPVIILERVGNV